MDHPDPTYRTAGTAPEKIVHYALQPAAIVLILWYWLQNPGSAEVFPIVLVSLHLVFGVLERLMPARPGWIVSGRQQLILSLIHISEPTRPVGISRMPSAA